MFPNVLTVNLLSQLLDDFSFNKPFKKYLCELQRKERKLKIQIQEILYAVKKEKLQENKKMIQKLINQS